MPAAPLQLMIYDRSNGGGGRTPGLSASWWLGGRVFGALGRFDRSSGFDEWATALKWIAAQSHASGRPIGEIQYWGHGRPGMALMRKEALDAGTLEPGHPLAPALAEIRAHLLPGGTARWWFRTCETFGGEQGRAFARAWTRFFGCCVAGHTFIIGPWQSGLHELAAGEEPSWSVDEGVGRWSRPGAPGTISFLQSRVPSRARTRA